MMPAPNRITKAHANRSAIAISFRTMATRKRTPHGTKKARGRE